MHHAEPDLETLLRSRPRPRPRVRLQSLLYLLTALTTFAAGAVGWEPLLLGVDDADIAAAVQEHWGRGLIYTAAVMAVLTAHEAGHFIAAKLHGIPATLPFFIPMPILLTGTLGAVIGMEGSRADRRQLFDIAIAGPLAGLVVAIPPLIVLGAFARRSHLASDWLSFPAMWLWNAMALVAFTGVYLFSVRRALRWLGQRRERRFGWKAQLQEWQGDAVEPHAPPAPGRPRNLSQQPTAGAARRVHRPRFLRPVWSNPVAWREVVTGVHGGVGRFIGWGYAAALAGLLLLCLVPDFVDDPDGPLGAAFLALAVAWLATALAAASSASGELRAQSLALLVTTRMSPSAIVSGKVLGVLAVAGPPLLAAIALLIGGVGQFSPAYRWAWDDSLFDQDLLIVRWAGMSAFAVAVTAWLITSNLWLGLRARSPGRAWVLCLLNVAAWVFLPAILRLMVDGDDSLEGLVRWFNPALDEDFWQHEALPRRVWGSALGWLGMSALAFRMTASSLGSRAGR